MEKQLKAVAESYDHAIGFGRRGIDLYEEMPPEISADPDYALFRKMRAENSLSDSARPEIRRYLAPAAGMKFVDPGCCLNLMFGGCDQWPSLYHGVDISAKTIELLKEHAAKKNLSVGALHCGSMHDTPFAADFFDIGACIGSLEYFERDFVQTALQEAHRILKPGARFALDIPDAGSPEFRITAKIEAQLGRADLFDLSVQEFEIMLANYFETDQKEKVGPMLQYFLRCKKEEKR